MTTSVYKYLDLDSTYRDRTMFPDPAEFIVYPSGNSGSLNTSSLTGYNTSDPILKGYPYLAGTIGTTGVGATDTTIDISGSYTTPTSLNATSIRVGDYLALRLGSDASIPGTNPIFRKITAYNGSTQVTVASAFGIASAAGSSWSVQKNIPFYTGHVNDSPATTTTTFTLNSSAETPPSTDLTGKFVIFTRRESGGTTNLSNPPSAALLTGTEQQVIRRISSYDTTTKLVTVDTPFPADISAGTSTTSAFWIFDVESNNRTFMITPGKNVAVQDGCYTIELLYLILPNKTLKSSYGGTFANYPYFYLQIYNEGNRHANPNILFSNNPNSKMCLYKIPMGFSLSSETFFLLKDSSCIQTIKLNMNEPIHFKLIHSSGELVQFVLSDVSTTGMFPIPFLQISCGFELRRLE